MQTRFDAKIAVLFVVVPVWLVASAALQGTLGSIGPDGDDVMRLVQIKDLLNGQDWFDLHQYRMGPDGGTAMHWSRLVDLPILALFSLFDLFLPSETALVWAYSAWPPLSVLIVLGGLYVGARQVGGRAGSLACLVLSIFVYSAHYRFRPGAIDHHNLQLALMAVAMGLALDPQRRASRAVGAGLALAASVAIGGEVYVFAAAICAFMALDWAVSGAAAMRSAAGFGAGLAAGLEIAFFATVAPSQYTVVACDALSAVSLLALVLVGPECLSNPLDELSPDVKTLWLDRVDEARPIFAERSDLVAKLGFCLGITVLALGLCLYGLYRRQRMRANFLFVALLVSAVTMTLYQTRFYVFGHLFAVIPLGLWIADVYRTGKARSASSVAYIGALALSVPFLWALPGLLVSPAVETNKTGDKADCLQDGLFATLETLPKGRVLAPADFGPKILNRTDHNVLQGNYHRNQDGISQAIELLLSHAGETRAKLSRSRIDYIVTCPADAETKLMTTHDQDGFAARLKRQEIPDFLDNIPLDTGAKTPARLYRVLGDGAVDQKDEDLS